VWVQAALEKEKQLRHELEERLSKESSMTDQVAAAQVLISVVDAAAHLIVYISANNSNWRH